MCSLLNWAHLQSHPYRLEWDFFDQGIIQLVKKLPRDSAIEKLQEISFHSFKVRR